MTRSALVWKQLRGAIAPGLGVLVVAFFGGYALFGANGALAWGDYSRRLHQREADLARVEARRAALTHRVSLLDPRHADPDLVDELVRRDLGVTRPDEVIIRLK